MHVATTPSELTLRAAPPSGTLVAGIAGASGYAGRELARLLAGHPAFTVGQRQARSEGYDALDVEALAVCDMVFLCLPHGESATFGNALAHVGTPVVDLGSDFRLAEGWVYGLTELARDSIAGAARVSNPGCYATAAVLALAPLVRAGLLDGPPAIDGKSGVSGAGRVPSEKTHLPSVHGGVQPYSPTGHRHIAEIERALSEIAGEPRLVTFTPHLAPHSRGLEITAYARLTEPLTQDDAEQLYRVAYAGEPFVRVTQKPHPGLLHGSNAVDIGVWVDARTNTVIAAAALDNLVKGAAGQALQNANLMLGLDEGLGLTSEGLGA
ncbi:MAG: N-acetyl-gamma-glutamyl-phosphate reductase [Gaiellales bacterium]|jgi:N-acetyl-gamma-glutamyl-phosphate reductase|nr:N-acetyl-gamma-glutamyl-phosphate reductase [Gaiellales bacterium]